MSLLCCEFWSLWILSVSGSDLPSPAKSSFIDSLKKCPLKYRKSLFPWSPEDIAKKKHDNQLVIWAECIGAKGFFASSVNCPYTILFRRKTISTNILFMCGELVVGVVQSNEQRMRRNIGDFVFSHHQKGCFQYWFWFVEYHSDETFCS